jgi:hypothetical protein
MTKIVESIAQPAKNEPEPVVTGKVEVQRARVVAIDQVHGGSGPKADRPDE